MTTPLESTILSNVRAGLPAVEDLGAGKTLGRAQHAVVDLLERGLLELSPLDEGPPFLVTARGAAALEPQSGLR